jgi:membrane protein
MVKQEQLAAWLMRSDLMMDAAARNLAGEVPGTIVRRRPGSSWRRWKHIGIHTFQAITDMDTSLRCAGVAFFGFLSLFPTIATIVLLYGLLADSATLTQTLDQLRYIVPGMPLDVVRGQLASLISQPAATLGFGLLLSACAALWSGSRGVNALMFAMSRVRGEPEQRGLIKTVFMSVSLTIAGSLFMVVSLTAMAGLPALTRLLPFPSAADLLILAVRWPALLALSVVLVSAFYRWGPDRHPRRLRYIWPGALLSSVAWVLAGLVFSIYVENFGNFEASFGSLTAAIVLLLWMYNSAQVFVLGAAFNAQLEYEDVAEAGKPGQIE